MGGINSILEKGNELMITIGICDDDEGVLSQLENMINSQYKDVDVKSFKEPLKSFE